MSNGHADVELNHWPRFEALGAETEPNATETYEQYLVRLDLLGHGFAFSELYGGKLSIRKRMPPRSLWHRMALTLACANDFRAWCRKMGACDGLRVNATYRPLGGASASQHKVNSAIDLDRIGGDGEDYFRCAVEFWCAVGKQTNMGLGLYTWGSKVTGGIRVHMDTGWRVRSWQGVGSGFKRPWLVNGKYYGLPVYLAKQQGLDVPGLSDV